MKTKKFCIAAVCLVLTGGVTHISFAKALYEKDHTTVATGPNDKTVTKYTCEDSYKFSTRLAAKNDCKKMCGTDTATCSVTAETGEYYTDSSCQSEEVEKAFYCQSCSC